MDAGDLDRRIALQSPTVTIAADGGQSTAWADEAVVWAKVVQKNSGEDESNRKLIAVRTLEITIRYYSGFSNTWSVVYEGNRYRIRGAAAEIGRRAYLQFEAELEGSYSNA